MARSVVVLRVDDEFWERFERKCAEDRRFEKAAKFARRYGTPITGRLHGPLTTDEARFIAEDWRDK